MADSSRTPTLRDYVQAAGIGVLMILLAIVAAFYALLDDLERE